MANLQNLRDVEAFDLEIFAIHSGELYERHKQLARCEGKFGWSAQTQVTEWLKHVRNVVAPLYRRQVEDIGLPDGVALRVAAGLADYYRQHIKELDQN